VPTDARTSAVQKLNRLMLDATLAERSALRYTPAGIPALDCVLKHASTQAEAGGKRNVECELAAVAFGDPAKALATVPTGTAVRCRGFLARRYRTGITVALHVDQFETLDHALEGN
jgi:primosomal replication protein N